MEENNMKKNEKTLKQRFSEDKKNTKTTFFSDLV
jgi:hypothetical protein